MKKQIWEDIYKIHSFNVDSTTKITLASVANFLQESAWKHAENLEVGYSQLIKKNLAWVLSKMKIECKKFPKWGEKIVLKTWPSGYDKLYCYRDFILENESGDTLFTATTTWFVIDITSRRPQRTDTYFPDEIIDIDPIFPNRTEKIKFDKPLTKHFENKVLFKDVDVNEHLNNVKYIEWAIDTLSSEERGKNILKVIANFNAEAILDDSVNVFRTHLEGNQIFSSLQRDSDKKELCKISIEFK